MGRERRRRVEPVKGCMTRAEYVTQQIFSTRWMTGVGMSKKVKICNFQFVECRHGIWDIDRCVLVEDYSIPPMLSFTVHNQIGAAQLYMLLLETL